VHRSAKHGIGYFNIIIDILNFARKFIVGRYLYEQPAITPHMRAVLVDWLVQVNSEFENQLETFFLAIKMVDKFFK